MLINSVGKRLVETVKSDIFWSSGLNSPEHIQETPVSKSIHLDTSLLPDNNELIDQENDSTNAQELLTFQIHGIK